MTNDLISELILPPLYLRDTHRSLPARVRVARVARRRLGPGGGGRRWSTTQTSVGATVEAAETPVGTVEVRDAH